MPVVPLCRSAVLLISTPNQWLLFAIPPHKEGRFAIVTNVEAGCGGRFGVARASGCRAILFVSDSQRARRATHVAYGKAVWSWHPLLVSSPRRLNKSNRSCCAANSLDDGDKQEVVAEESPV